MATQGWTVQREAFDSPEMMYDANDPAMEEQPQSEQPLSLDDQIKAFEALQAAQARHLGESPERAPVRVSFAEDALLYSSDRHVDEIQSLWYSRDELNEFKNERKEIVRVLKRTNFDLIAVEASGRYCLRGYEPYFSMEVNKAMKYARTLVTSLVLAEQERQRSANCMDEDVICQSSSCASQWARDNARQLGMNDEMEVFREYEYLLQQIAEESESSHHQQHQQQQQEYLHQPQHIDDSMCDYNDIIAQNNCDYTDNNTLSTGSLTHESSHHEDSSYSSNEMILEESSLLGKRKDIEQPEFTSRARAPGRESLHSATSTEDDTSSDPLAERLDSALKLVEALKFGNTRSQQPPHQFPSARR